MIAAQSPFERSEQRVLGVDPGAHGALALLDFGRGWEYRDCADMPVRDIGKTETRNALDARQLRKLVEHWSPTIAVIEDVHPMPDTRQDSRACPACKRSRSSMPSTQAFVFGGLCGGVRAVLEALGLEVLLVGAPTWKRAAGLATRGTRTNAEVKAESLQLARSLWPDAPLTLARHEARAEAMLIARFGLSSQMRFL